MYITHIHIYIYTWNFTRRVWLHGPASYDTNNEGQTSTQNIGRLFFVSALHGSFFVVEMRRFLRGGSCSKKTKKLQTHEHNMLSHPSFQKLACGMQTKSKLSLCCKLLCSNIQSICLWEKRPCIRTSSFVFSISLVYYSWC